MIDAHYGASSFSTLLQPVPPSAAWHFCLWPCSSSVTAVWNMEIHFSCNRLSESDIQRCAGRVLWDLQEKSRNGEPRFVCHTTSVFFLTVAFLSLTVRVVKCSLLCGSFPFAWPDPELWLSPVRRWKKRPGELVWRHLGCDAKGFAVKNQPV